MVPWCLSPLPCMFDALVMRQDVSVSVDDTSQSESGLSKDQGDLLFDADSSTAAYEALERDFQEVGMVPCSNKRIWQDSGVGK